MTERQDFVTSDGRPAVAELAYPAGGGRHPAIVVIPEWWGLNDDVRRISRRFADEGFVAAALDLYEGRVTADAEVAAQWMEALRTPEAVARVAAVVKGLASHPRCTGQVAVTGFCLGGALALATACAAPTGLACAVAFYGIPPAEHADWSRLRAPVMAHFGRTDPIIPLAKVQALAAAMAEAGVDLSLHQYDAGHAFMREGGPGYDAAAAQLAWGRTLAFLRARLPSGAAG